MAIPVTVARHDPGKEGEDVSETREIDSGEVSCQKGADEHGQEGKRKSPLDAKEHTGIFPTVLARLAKNHARSAHST